MVRWPGSSGAGRGLGIVAALTLAAALPVLGAEPVDPIDMEPMAPSAADAGASCGGDPVSSGRVMAPDGPTTGPVRPHLRLDGAADPSAVPAGVVLAGVVLPASAGLAAATRLAERLDMLEGSLASVFAERARRDRRGRIAGQVVVSFDERSGPMAAIDRDGWLQASLVRAGLVIVDAGDDPCTAPLLAIEAEARAAKAGLWGDADFVRSAVAFPGQRDKTGLPDFVVMEGRVVSVGNSGATTYLNFGRIFRTDVTVRVARRNSADFPADKTLSEFGGVLVRVRGWAEVKDGIDLPVTSAAAIERIEERRETRRIP